MWSIPAEEEVVPVMWQRPNVIINGSTKLATFVLLTYSYYIATAKVRSTLNPLSHGSRIHVLVSVHLPS